MNYVDVKGTFWGPPPYIPYRPFALEPVQLPRVDLPTRRDDVQQRPVQSPAEAIFGQILNWFGKGSNWIGPNRSGGAFSETVDFLGRLPLGNTMVPGRNWMDDIGRRHDIQDYVNWHFPAGKVVPIPGPSGEEMYASRGPKSMQHNWEAAGASSGVCCNGIRSSMTRHFDRCVACLTMCGRIPYRPLVTAAVVFLLSHLTMSAGSTFAAREMH